MENTHEEETKAEVTTEQRSTPVETETVPPLVTAPVAPVPFYKNKPLVISILVALVLVAAAGYFVFMQHKNGGVVAVVNGTSIYKNEFDESVSLIKQAAKAQGVDLTQAGAEKDIQDQALTTLVNNVLILSAAKKAGFKASNEDIQKKYDELVKQIGTADELKKKMADVGLTEAKLRSNISDRILADAYIQSTTTMKDIKVTDDEVNAFYKALDDGKTKLPALTEIRPQIEQQILGQKQQQIVTDLIAKLRASAKIDVKI